MVNTHHCLVTPMGRLVIPIQKITKVEIMALDFLHPILPDQYQHMQKYLHPLTVTKGQLKNAVTKINVSYIKIAAPTEAE